MPSSMRVRFNAYVRRGVPVSSIGLFFLSSFLALSCLVQSLKRVTSALKYRYLKRFLCSKLLSRVIEQVSQSPQYKKSLIVIEISSKMIFFFKSVISFRCLVFILYIFIGQQ